MGKKAKEKPSKMGELLLASVLNAQPAAAPADPKGLRRAQSTKSRQSIKSRTIVRVSSKETSGLRPPDQASGLQKPGSRKGSGSACSASGSLKEQSPWVQLILLHCGLVGLCGVYILAGALVFYLIESPNEAVRRRQGLERLAASRLTLQEDIQNAGHIAVEQEAKEAFGKALDRHMEVLFSLHEDPYVRVALSRSGEPLASFEAVWTGKSAILLALTTVTTVGFGFVTPATEAGRLFAVGFGLLGMGTGIPLTLVTTADLARFMGLGVVTAMLKAQRLCRRLRKRRSSSKSSSGAPALKVSGAQDESEEEEELDVASVPISLTLLILVSYPILGGLYFLRCRPDWTYPDAVYFATVTILTVGYGDMSLECYVPLLLYLLAGIIVVTMCVDLVGSEWIEQIHFLGRRLGKAKLLAGRMRSGIGGLGAMMASLAAAQRQLGALEEGGQRYAGAGPFAPSDWQEFKYAEARRSLLPSQLSTYETFSSLHSSQG